MIITMKSITLFNLFVVTFFVCLSMKNVSSLRCYVCESNVPDDKSCSKLDPSMIVTCRPDQLVCRTFKAGGNPVKGFNLIQRTCGTLKLENIYGFVDINNIDRTLKEGVAVHSMICNTDLCNAAPAILKNSPTFCLFISVILFLKHVY